MKEPWRLLLFYSILFVKSKNSVYICDTIQEYIAIYSDYTQRLSLMTKTLRCMKHLILTVILVCITLQTNAQQSLSYAYDAAGNRIGRTIVLETRASKALQNKTDSIFFHEMLAEKQLKIYPNPVLSELTLSITGYQLSLIHI